MSLSKKHYIAIARAIKESQAHSGNQGDDLIVQQATVDRICDALCQEFRRDNPNFDTGRFLAACGSLR